MTAEQAVMPPKNNLTLHCEFLYFGCNFKLQTCFSFFISTPFHLMKENTKERLVNKALFSSYSILHFFLLGTCPSLPCHREYDVLPYSGRELFALPPPRPDESPPDGLLHPYVWLVRFGMVSSSSISTVSSSPKSPMRRR